VNTDFLKDFSNKTKETFEPVTKFNELLSQSVQDAFKAQMASTKKYSEFASSQFKALSEVRDTDSLQQFFKGQMEAFSTLNEQLMEDLKTLVETGEKFRDEVSTIMTKTKNEKPPKTDKKPIKEELEKGNK
jgi:phasin family protein